MIDTVRALIAVNLDMGATRRMVALQRNASAGAMDEQGDRDELMRWAWTSPAALHICLRDLGWVDEPLVRAVASDLRKITAPLATAALGAAMMLKLEPLRALPEPTRAKLLVVEVQDPEGGLMRLAQQVDECLTSMGFPPRVHAFRPSVVIARRRDPVDLQPWFDALAAGPASHWPALVRGQAEATELAIYYVPVESFEPVETTTLAVAAAPLPALGEGKANPSPSDMLGNVLGDRLGTAQETTPSALDEAWGKPQAAAAEARPETADASTAANATAKAPHEIPSWTIAHPWASKQGIELACLARMALMSQARARQLAAEAPRAARGRQRSKSAANQRPATERTTRGRGRASSALQTPTIEPSSLAEKLPSETASPPPTDENGWGGVTVTSPDIEAFELDALDEESPGPDLPDD